MGMQYGMTYGDGTGSSGYMGTSSTGYYNLARRWNDKAVSLGATITSLKASVSYTEGQLAKALEVKAKTDEAAQLQVTAEEDLSTLGADLATATEVEGVQMRASSLGRFASEQVAKVQGKCQTLVDGLQEDLDALNESLATAQESYDDAVSKARAYTTSGNIAAAREREARG